MAGYSEYLKSMGATDEEIKLLDTPLARKAYDKLEDGVVRLSRERDDAQKNMEAYETRANSWYEENKGLLTSAKAEAVSARAESGRLREALLAAQKQGLIDITKDLGLKMEELERGNPTPTPTPTPSAFDQDKFINEVILPIAEREGDAIAIAQDIAAEHSVLFPGKPLRFRELRQRAVASKKSVEAQWMEEFGVPAARVAKAQADKDKELQTVRSEERKKVEAEFAAKYASNPFTRTLEPSSAPFAPRTGTDPRAGKQPWEVGTAEQLHDTRVRKGTELALKREVTH